MVNPIGNGTGGMGNFFDVNEIADKLTTRQQMQISNLQKNEKTQQAHLTIYNNLKTFLTGTLQTNLQALSQAFSENAYKVNVSNPSIISATIGNNANVTASNHNVIVNALAQAESIASTASVSDKTAAVFINDTLNFSIGTSSFSVDVTTRDTLESVRDNINNNSSNIGITAAIMTTTNEDGSAQNTLVVSSDNTGIENKVTITGDLNNQFGFNKELVAAQDANLSFDGYNVVRSSNYITDVIDGLSFSLLATSLPNQPVSLSVTASTATRNADVLSAFNNVVNAYNNLIGFIDQNQADKANHDDIFPLIKLSISNAVNLPYEGNGPFNKIADIGIKLDSAKSMSTPGGEFYKSSGQLIVDTKNGTLNDAISNNFSALKSMILDENSGFIANMNKAISQLMDSRGPINQEEIQLNANINDIEDSIANKMANLEIVKDSLVAKFMAANDIIRRFEQTSSFLKMQLDSLTGNNRK